MLLHKVDTLVINQELEGVPVQYMLWPKTTEGWGQKVFYPLDELEPPKAPLQKAESQPTIIPIVPLLINIISDSIMNKRFISFPFNPNVLTIPISFSTFRLVRIIN